MMQKNNREQLVIAIEKNTTKPDLNAKHRRAFIKENNTQQYNKFK